MEMINYTLKCTHSLLNHQAGHALLNQKYPEIAAGKFEPALFRKSLDTFGKSVASFFLIILEKSL